tara:strand:+ start:1867 stop:2529 length:663 start_codon:yes stop_codon:yes gene_type:complete
MNMEKIKILLMILVVLGWSCKENPEQKIEAVKEAIQTTPEIPESIKEIATFAMPTLADTENLQDLIIFKELNASGTIAIVDMAKAGDLYKKLAARGQETLLPIFEVRDTDLVVLTMKGVGFGGAIWAKVLLDKKSLEIINIAFEHKAESDGYGAAFTKKTFTDQFIGVKINPKEDTFALQKAGDDLHFIDGISGATMTSKGAVAMVNEGLRKYSGYLMGE